MNNTKMGYRWAIVVVLLSWLLTFVVISLVSKEHPIQSLPSGDIKKATETK